MRHLIRLANGTRISHTAVRAIEARALGRPHIDQSGREWPALVVVETRNQVLRVPCASFAEAEAMRETLDAEVEQRARREQRRRDEGGDLHARGYGGFDDLASAHLGPVTEPLTPPPARQHAEAL